MRPEVGWHGEIQARNLATKQGKDMADNEKTDEPSPDYLDDPRLSEDDKIRLREFNTETGSWTGGVYHPELELAHEQLTALPDYLKTASLSAAGLDAVREFHGTTGRWPDPGVLDTRPPAYFEDPRLRSGDLRDVEDFRAKTGIWVDPQFFDQMLATREAEDPPLQPPPPPRKRVSWLVALLGFLIGWDLAR